MKLVMDSRIIPFIKSTLQPGCELESAEVIEQKRHSPTQPSYLLDVHFKNAKGAKLMSRYNYLKMVRHINEMERNGLFKLETETKAEATTETETT